MKALYFWTDGNKIYFRGYEIKVVDIDTFEAIAIPNITGTPSQYAKGKNHYYMNDEVCSKEDFDNEISEDIRRSKKLEELWKKSRNP